MQVKRVSHGFANLVYRLTFSDLSTVILKYYSPRGNDNAADDDEEEAIELSQNRYHIEKNALATLIGRNVNEMIRTPRLLHSDDSLCYIVMQDCGERLKTLASLLRNAGNSGSSNENEAVIDDFLRRLARNMKLFLANLNASIHRQTYAPFFANNQYWDGMNHNRESVCSQVAQALELDAELADLGDDYLMADSRLEEPSVGAKFVHGNLEPGSVLIDLDRQQAWILDWEMARFDDERRDLEAMLFSLWLMKQNARLFSVKRIELFMRRMQLEFLGDESVDWRQGMSRASRVNYVSLLMTALVVPGNFGARLENPRETALKAINELKLTTLRRISIK